MASGLQLLRPRAGAPVEIGTDGQIPPGSIQENTTYTFELTEVDSPFSYELMVDGDRLERNVLSPTTVRWAWPVGFYAGELQLRLEQSGRAILVRNLVTDPDVRKATREDFATMVQEILADTIALISLSSHHMRVAAGNGTVLPAIARLEFLWTRMTEIDDVIRRIISRPQRRLEPEIRNLPISQVRRLTGSEFRRSMRGGRVGVLKDPARLPERLGGKVPLTVVKNGRAHGVDTLENRQVKQSLRLWAVWLQVVEERLAAQTGQDAELRSQERKWASRCRVMSRRLNDLASGVFFDQVSDRTGPARVTPAFRRLPQYRRFLEIHRDFGLGMANVVGDFLELPLSRTFDLYELWAFLRLARAAKMLYPEAPFDPSTIFTPSPDRITVTSGGGSFAFGPGFELWFKKGYREYWIESSGRGTFSREMVPDYSFGPATGGPERPLVVIDAKYRIDDQLSAALASTHMYRDALVRQDGADSVRRIVVGAYLVTPWFPLVDEGNSWKSAAMPARLFHPEYRGEFKFGAFTLRPGQSLEAAAAVLTAVINDVQPAA